MSIYNSDADLREAQTPPTLLENITFFGGYEPATLPPNVQIGGLTLMAFGGNVGTGPSGGYYIDNGDVILRAAPSSYGSFIETFSGEISDLEVDTSGAGGPCDFTLNLQPGASIDNMELNPQSSSDSLTVNTSQTSPVGIGYIALSSLGQSIVLNLDNVTDLTLDPPSGFTSGVTFELNGAWDSATTTDVLSKIYGAGAYGSTFIIGGTSGSPIITPEMDTIALSAPSNGNSFDLTGDGTTILTFTFDASIPFSASNLGTIGISDSPTLSQIAGYIAGLLGDFGFTASASGATVHVSTSLYTQWPLAVSNASGSAASLTNVQAGVDYVGFLIEQGNTVTTN